MAIWKVPQQVVYWMLGLILAAWCPGPLVTGELQIPQLAITMKANLTFGTSTLFTWVAKPKIL